MDCSYTLNYGDVASDTGYAKQQFEELDKKYKERKEYEIDDSDLPLLIKGMEWLLVMKDDSDVLQIDRADGLRLLELIKSGKKEIQSSDWSY
ncbi:MAG: hypothetical protein RL141_687 [Candidatus Parcubacteria bacterium]|jgi:hypothetical protein